MLSAETSVKRQIHEKAGNVFCRHENKEKKMQEKRQVKILLEDGTEYLGTGFGAETSKCVELVFNTSMVGYQEILSDPSYTDQAVVMTYPLIGNYGICDDDFESHIMGISGLIVHEYCDSPSNFRCSATLSDIMKKHDIVGVENVDTRRIARHIRDYGSCRAIICSADMDSREALETLTANPVRHDQVARATSKETHEYCTKGTYHVVAIDCGMKENILRFLQKRDCRVTVVPYDTSSDDILALEPDGIFISNGPGDPEDVKKTIFTICRLRGKKPIFGICLGHQIISLAFGAETYKLKFGHRGGNHPVKNLITGRVEITSQNHSYAVREESLRNTGLIPTHVNILDNTIEGVECAEDYVFSVQYHPESAPGPQDSAYLFDKFIENMKKFREEQ